MRKPFRGTVKGWEIHELPDRSGMVFTGTVEDATENAQFKGGRHIMSSLIVGLRRVDDFYEAQTLNSTYHLVGPAGDEALRLKCELMAEVDDSEVQH